MRAESHYVDLLEARASELRERAASARILDDPEDTEERHDPLPARNAPLSAVAAPVESAPVPAAAADPTLHAGRDLAQSLSTVAACADLLNSSPSELSRVVVGNLIRAEAWRASALLHQTRVVRQELPVARTPVSIPGLVDQVIQGFVPERRARPFTLDARVDLPHGSFMAGDQQMLASALSGAVLATLALMDGVPHARLVLSASGDDHQVTFAVTQDAMTPAQQWHARAFDPQWTDRAGGVPALVAMLAVQETARTHGGRATISLPGRGTTIAFTLPIGV